MAGSGRTTDADGLLRPPTPEQEETYDASEEEGDLFHEAAGVHVQCQAQHGELWVHNIEIAPDRRRSGMGRGILSAIRDERPGEPIVANGVDWDSDAGRFWQAMVGEGIVDRVVTYGHGEITAADIGRSAPSP